MNQKLPVFELGATSKEAAWGPRLLIAAQDETAARALAKWDYSDETEYCEKLEGLFFEGGPQIVFCHRGD